MRSSYKKLGQFIKEVNVRNKDLNVDLLLGVSIKKILMPSIANTIGTDMTTYKIIKRNQFAYGPVTSRNGDKISIAILVEYDKAIVSQAYTVFKIIDKTELNPEYLMMWFRRSEFDRYARFKSHGSARETFDWSELCETELPIPSIEKQQEIVKEYNVVKNRITLKEQLNQNLEETAQALYKHWFVDFEFPVTKESHPELVSGSKLIGYKSAGGKMVFNEELDKEIPVGWELLPISQFCDVTFSKRIYQSEYCENGVPFYRSKEIILKKSGTRISNELYITKNRYKELTNKFGAITKGDILLTAVGTIGVSYLITTNDDFYFKDGNLFWFKNFKKNGYNKLLYEWMQTQLFKEKLEEITFGSTQKVITTTAVYLLKHVSPYEEVLIQFNLLVGSIHKNIEDLRSHSFYLNVLKELLLSKMVRLEKEKETV